MSEPAVSQEHQALLSSLNDQRDHVLGILDGLSEEDLRRPVLPSGWSCLALVHHLAIDVEQFWFRRVVAGEEMELGQSTGSAWDIGGDEPVDAVFDLYRKQVRLADAVISATALDAAPLWWPEEVFGTWRLHDLREIVLHVIAETACHAGHLDAVRELIDGRRWVVLT
ncbi:MAG: DinB family protein [Acidimicrobiales bacterium]|jgi:hypothetical protein